MPPDPKSEKPIPRKASSSGASIQPSITRKIPAHESVGLSSAVADRAARISDAA
jgi:hypothetical protein